jgi:hypothetical protein
MQAPKPTRPAFQSLELDPIDVRLDAKAAEKGIPTLVAPKAQAPLVEELPDPPEPAVPVHRPGRGVPPQATPRSRMKALKIDLPDYAWVALKKRAAEQMTSLRHVIMVALRAEGIHINDVDMNEDGRRLRK